MGRPGLDGKRIVALYMGWAKLLSLISVGVEFASAWTGVGVHPRNVLARRAVGVTWQYVSAGNKQPTQNWHGPGESDCLIKTELCVTPCGP